MNQTKKFFTTFLFLMALLPYLQADTIKMMQYNMLYYTTTYYKTQATTGNFTNPTETLRGRPRPAPGREHVGGENGVGSS